ncbi:short neuropeptide F-like [Temnothorax curvispinosus]|uniref:Short neuropeptide F-like n=1 Tax=Temnothorax curvispinosus TaxID=300111 RepID=A0A6J1QFW9_9HYME|nr:short neuropeptide F-like [Temnothorax curvispinosus]
MYAKRCAAFILLVVIAGLVNATENYMDYGEEMAEKVPAENIHELYRLLLQRNEIDNGFGGIPLEHLMIRKSQRSPSLRLRFGRSGPHLSAGALPRPLTAAAAAGYEDNN